MSQKERIILQGNEFYEIDIECENRKKLNREDKKRKQVDRQMKTNQLRK